MPLGQKALLQLVLELQFQARPGMDRFPLIEQSHTRQAGRRTELIPGEAVTMKKSLKLGVITQKRIENSLRGQGCGHGQSAPDSFPAAQ